MQSLFREIDSILLIKLSKLQSNYSVKCVYNIFSEQTQKQFGLIQRELRINIKGSKLQFGMQKHLYSYLQYKSTA